MQHPETIPAAPPPDVFPSIFNDVIGPVMRGPSSSHSAAALRMGKIARALMDGCMAHVLVEFDRSGSLPLTHTSHGSDMGLAGGILGFEMDDARLLLYEEELEKKGIAVHYRIDDFGDLHPNTYRITIENSAETHSMIALSTGGGMLQVIDIDGADMSFQGDLFMTLVYCDGNAKAILDKCACLQSPCALKIGQEKKFVEMLSFQAPLAADLDDIAALANVQYIRSIPPVLPILRPRDLRIPFYTIAEMTALAHKQHLDLDALALLYESQRGDIPQKAVLQHIKEIVHMLRSSINTGLTGTNHKDRILGYQSGAYLKKSKSGRLMDLGVMNRIVPYVTSLMEVKSALGVIVAAPTAGSCGCLPGAVLGAADTLEKDNEAAARAMLAAGMVGIFITRMSTFAAEVGGCQVECGAGSAMAAAGLTTLLGGGTVMALGAASMALQNSLGMICDPVACRVEVPCLGKNIMASANAVTCANMALAGFDAVVPLEEVIETMDRVGKRLPRELKCTGLGGLSITPTAKAVEKKLAKCKPESFST